MYRTFTRSPSSQYSSRSTPSCTNQLLVSADGGGIVHVHGERDLVQLQPLERFCEGKIHRGASHAAAARRGISNVDRNAGGCDVIVDAVENDGAHVPGVAENGEWPSGGIVEGAGDPLPRAFQRRLAAQAHVAQHFGVTRPAIHRGRVFECDRSQRNVRTKSQHAHSLTQSAGSSPPQRVATKPTHLNRLRDSGSARRTARSTTSAR